ncbi:MAG: deoxyguanosinetriphosphate triphosphohydrolase [Planctomycetes bacterium]|jgi:dGTPase|nr:deoxyguanosinetriphosphate triphosphohydrolase [Phycisphaerae bacterium]NBB95405.1 deoxyguanosinetriphosphate triphosphohydrolase [Planctomycetota bacterium]
MPAAYAVTDAECIRRHDEPDDPYRSALQRDRDRVIHCTAFRRLDYKTQVFVPHEHDHFRTRLTHTIEVAQIARDAARALDLNEDLVEAVALAHDLGHPPFGHGGEAILDELMADVGHFEHNRQSLRIVDYLEHPYPQFRGLNLTQPTRECLAKHETRFDTPVCAEFTDGRHAPLEGQLVDLADAIAYSSADLEDALTGGWLGEAELAALPLWQHAWAKAEADYGDVRPIHKRIRATKNVIALLVADCVETTRRRIEAFGIDSGQTARGADAKAVSLSEDGQAWLDGLVNLLFDRVYRHPVMVEAETQSRTVIRELFECFMQRPDDLPSRYRARVDDQGLPRVICDYIAGMTDRFCRAEHARLITH